MRALSTTIPDAKMVATPGRIVAKIIKTESTTAGEHGESLAFAVRHMELDFHAPARIDDLLEVETRLREARGARLVLDQSIRRGGTLLFHASVTVVVISAQGRPRRLPAGLAERLAQPACQRSAIRHHEPRPLLGHWARVVSLEPHRAKPVGLELLGRPRAMRAARID